MTGSSTGALPDLAVDPEWAGFSTRPDYYEVLARLRREAPVFGYAPNRWTIARYHDVRAISRDPERFCSGRGVLMRDPKRDGDDLPGSILHMDPPQHGEWRRVGSRWFTPRAVARLEDQVRAVTRQLLDEVPTGVEVDAVDALTAPIPVLVIAELLGIADTDRRRFRVWSDACIEEPADDDGSTDENGPMANDDRALGNMVAVGELLEFLTEHTVARRSEPRDDLLSALVGAEVEGRPMHDHEVVMYCLSLLVAGNETSRHLLSGALALLAEHPDQRARLTAHPDAVPDAVEECLRWVTPIQTFARTATEDVDLGGQLIAEGDWVVLLYASANREEDAFGPDAGRFDAMRAVDTSHLAFGFGEHLCLGASLARLEARVFLEELLARFPDYRITGEPSWTRSTLVRGFVSLPAVLA